MSRLRGYGRLDMPVINVVSLNVYFDNEKIKQCQIKLGNISAGTQLTRVPKYLVIACVENFQGYMICIWFVAVSVPTKTFQLNTKLKGKEEDKEMSKHSLFSLLSGAVFSHCLSIGLLLNRRTLVAAAPYETYIIPIVKKCNRFIVFFPEHKLYGFPRSEKS